MRIFMPSVPLARLAATFLSVLAAIGTPAALRAQSTLIPITTRRDMVFDHSGRYLYITTSDGWVRPYHLSSGQLETGYNLGGSLNGLDIAPDDSFLLVTQKTVSDSQGTIHKVDLTTGAITPINYSLYSADGAWDIAIGSGGRALFTTNIGGSGWTPLREIDLKTNTVTRRTDAPTQGSAGVYNNTQLHRSTDGNRIYIVETLPSAFVYDAPTATFGSSAHPRWFVIPASAAINRDGSLLANRRDKFVTVDNATDFSFRHSYNGAESGVAFDAVSDSLYVVDAASDQIVAYDTQNFAEKFRLAIGEPVPPNDRYSTNSGQFDTGTLVASNDGEYLALETPSGIRLIRVVSGVKLPVAAVVFEQPRDMVFDRAGEYLYITTSTGYVWPFSLTRHTLEFPYNIGGSLNAVDIAPNDSYLLIAQENVGLGGYGRGILEKLDLSTGAVTAISYQNEDYSYENGTWDLAIGSNGVAMFTTIFGVDGYSGWTPLRQINLATNVVTIRNDAPGSGSASKVEGNTIIDRSADRTRLLVREPNNSTGPTFSYSAVTNSFGPVGRFNAFHEHVNSAVSRDGSIMLLRYRDNDSLFLLPDLGFAHEWFGLDSGIAFDAVQDRFYAVKSTTDQIVAYDSGTYAERFRIAIGEDVSATPQEAQTPADPFGDAQFGIGTLVASQDGGYLALVTPNGIRIIDIAARSSTLLPLGSSAPPLGSPFPRNVSTRVVVGTDDDAPIAGFIITGSDPKKVVVRAIGPSLLAAGLTGTVTDPTLELHDASGGMIAFDDNWHDFQPDAIEQTGLSPADPREAAIVQTLPPGAYTAVMRGKNGETGIGLVEVYDAEATSNSVVANLSTRGFVGNGSSVMIAGMIIGRGGSGSGTGKIVVRGLGPSLAQFQLPRAILDPNLSLYDASGNVVKSNSNWKDTQQVEIQSTGLAPPDAREAALVVDLPPGNYTAVLAAEPSAGLGLVEIYALQ
jgi:hypothetical protein